MTNFARIIDNVAVDVSTAPQEQFHPGIAAQFETVPSEVKHGWKRINGIWTKPEPVQAVLPAQPAITVTPVEFMLLFTSAERVALKQARPSDPVIDDFFDIVEDPRLTHVNLGLQSTLEALDYFVSIDMLTTERKNQILTGTVS